MVEDYKFVGVNSITFNRTFQTEENCLKYLSFLKWENGYSCKRCSNDKYCQGKKPLNRRCTKCRYEESPTSGTMFDKVKFSPEENMRGRKKGSKKLVVLALEILDKGVGRAYAEVIENPPTINSSTCTVPVNGY